MLPYSESGQGKSTLVFLHFFGGSQRQWTEVVDILCEDYRCVTVDLPGFGDARDTPGYSVAEMSAQVSELVSSLDLRDFVLVGHSMSGKIAMAISKMESTNPSALILIAPSPPSPEPISDDNRQKMLALSRSHGDGEKYIKDNSAKELSVNVRERSIEDFERCSPEAWVAWLEKGSKEDWSSRIGVLRLPTFVIAGGKDLSLGGQVQQQATLPHFVNARFIVVEDSGHLLPLEFPGTVANQIDDFCRSLMSV